MPAAAPTVVAASYKAALHDLSEAPRRARLGRAHDDAGRSAAAWRSARRTSGAGAAAVLVGVRKRRFGRRAARLLCRGLLAGRAGHRFRERLYLAAENRGRLVTVPGPLRRGFHAVE